MALNIGNKVFRNIQEQVAYNSERILKIEEFLDGIDVEDHLIVLTESSGTLTAEQFKVAQLPTAYIKKDDTVYIKSSADSNYQFVCAKINITAIAGGGYKLSQDAYRVNKTTGAYASFTIVSLETYSKSEIDSIASGKADLTYVNNQLALCAKLSGADFTGGITAPSILETMSGYSYDKNNYLSVGVTPVYVGMSKTGNKLTIVQSLLIDATLLENSQPRFGSIYIPKSIGDKIYEFPNDLYGTLSIQMVPVFESGNYGAPDYTLAVRGSVNHNYDANRARLIFGINQFKSPEIDMTKTYFLRFEITILLSDNLYE